MLSSKGIERAVRRRQPPRYPKAAGSVALPRQLCSFTRSGFDRPRVSSALPADVATTGDPEE